MIELEFQVMIIAWNSYYRHRFVVLVTLDQEKPAHRIKADGECIVLLPAIQHKRCTHGISPPIDRIDTEQIAHADHWYFTLHGLHRVKADGHARIRRPWAGRRCLQAIVSSFVIL